MPSIQVAEEDDPVIASYDVYITNPNEESAGTSQLLVLQYPSHRPRSKPYNAVRSQKPKSLHWKRDTGLVEVEIPILTEEYYSPQAGQKFGQALSDNRLSHHGRSYGLAGGFNNAPSLSQPDSLHNIPHHQEDESIMLKSQILGGKAAFPSEKDPLYMLGVFRNDELHLNPVNAVVQMRPQLHHIDAEEDLNQKKFQATAANGKLKPGLELGPSKLETKAIELKLKDNKEDTKDRNLNENVKLLRDIQRESWKKYDWLDQHSDPSRKALRNRMVTTEGRRLTQLQSPVSNDDWLEKMSAPRQEGKKGLRSKLKGRDRERARRKKVENQKRLANAAAFVTAEVSSDESDSSTPSDIDMVEPSGSLAHGAIKQEPISLASASEQVPTAPNAVLGVSSTPKRRGRPRKDAENTV